MKSISDTRIVARLHRNGGKVLCGKRDAEGRYVCNEMLLVVVNFPDDLSRVKPGTEILYKEPRHLWAFPVGWQPGPDGMYVTAHALAARAKRGHLRNRRPAPSGWGPSAQQMHVAELPAEAICPCGTRNRLPAWLAKVPWPSSETQDQEREPID